MEATKFTEVGYHRRDMNQIIHDLIDVSINLTKKIKTEEFCEKTKDMVKDRIVDLLLIGSGEGNSSNKNDESGGSSSKGNTSSQESLDKALVEEIL